MRRNTSRRAAGLPEAAGEILASLALHRALSTPQVGELHLPGRTASWVQIVLGLLRAAGLAAYVQTGHAPRRLWYVTEAGTRAAQGAGLLEEPPRPLTAEQVAGPLWRHTHDVNEAAISFVRAARERGDEMGPLAWRHEVAHPLRAARGRRRPALISDAVLTYLRSAEGRVYVEQRFLEVDRATLSVDRLAAELAPLRGATRRERRRGRAALAATLSRLPRRPLRAGRRTG